MGNSAAEELLQIIYDEVIRFAVEKGLDPYFCYEFFTVCAAAPVGEVARSDYREKQSLAFEEAQKQSISSWLNGSRDQFKIQHEAMNGIMDKIEHYACYDDALTTANALLEFIIIQLGHQRRFLNVFIHFPLTFGLAADREEMEGDHGISILNAVMTKVGNRFGIVMTNRESVLERAKALKRHLVAIK